MTDTERLDLMTKYNWRIFYNGAMDWQCNGMFGHVRGGSPREVMDKALPLQERYNIEAAS